MKKSIKILFICILTIAFISLGLSIHKNTDYTPESTPISFNEIIYNCESLDITNTSLCFRDNIKTFYKYNLSSVEVYREDITKYFLYGYDENLKHNVGYLFSYDEQDFYDKMLNEGGECEQWTLFYEILTEKTEFNFETICLDTHCYGKIYNNENTCIVDQINVECKKNE